MVNAVEFIYRKAQEVERGSHTERFLTLTPIINSIFLEMKYAELRFSNKPELKKVAEKMHYWLWPQIILWAPAIAKLQRHLSFKWHSTLMISFSFYILMADRRITYIKDLS